MPNSETIGAMSRRNLLRGGAAFASAAAVASSAAQAAPATSRGNKLLGGLIADNPGRRAAEALQVRLRAARDLFGGSRREQATNGDESLYPDTRASFTKTLPHDDLGEGDPRAYAKMLDALRRRDAAAYAAIPLAPQATRKLANPEAAYGYTAAGLDTQACRMRPAPSFAGRESAGEMLELYWKALLRDVPFSAFGTNALVDRAAREMAAFGFRPGTPTSAAFRGETRGDRTGPFLSQFLLRDVPYGPSTIVQRYANSAPGADLVTDLGAWLLVQRGGVAGATQKSGARYVHDGRSLAEYVHNDFSFQAYINAALILLGMGPSFSAQGNPGRGRATTGTFVTFGGPDVLDCVSKAASHALYAAWFQKWAAHRRLRPEAYAGRLHHQIAGTKDYGLPADLIATDAVGRVRAAQGNALLSQTYPEGSPTHPSYPAGHATIAGACCTVLKAFFDEDAVMPAPVAPNANGTLLLPVSDTLTVGGEIDKLASNVSLGRDWAGVHYRSDGVDGLKVGEEVAIALLADHAGCYAEAFDGFTLTRFDGVRIKIDARGVTELGPRA